MGKWKWVLFGIDDRKQPETQPAEDGYEDDDDYKHVEIDEEDDDV